MPPSCCPDSHSAGTLSRDYALGRHPAAGCSFLANPSVSQILKIPWSDLGGFRRINRPPDLPHRLPLPLAQKPLEPDPPPAVAAWTPGALPAHSTFVLRHSRPPLIGHASFSFRAFFHHSPAPADKRQYRIYTFIENRACSARPPGGSHAAFPPPTRRPITTRGPANAERLDCGRFSAALEHHAIILAQKPYPPAPVFFRPLSSMLHSRTALGLVLAEPAISVWFLSVFIRDCPCELPKRWPSAFGPQISAFGFYPCSFVPASAACPPWLKRIIPAHALSGYAFSP